jgi:hypothetical protein
MTSALVEYEYDGGGSPLKPGRVRFDVHVEHDLLLTNWGH